MAEERIYVVEEDQNVNECSADSVDHTAWSLFGRADHLKFQVATQKKEKAVLESHSIGCSPDFGAIQRNSVCNQS